MEDDEYCFIFLYLLWFNYKQKNIFFNFIAHIFFHFYNVIFFLLHPLNIHICIEINRSKT